VKGESVSQNAPVQPELALWHIPVPHKERPHEYPIDSEWPGKPTHDTFGDGWRLSMDVAQPSLNISNASKLGV
jgi:hypothetical protein